MFLDIGRCCRPIQNLCNFIGSSLQGMNLRQKIGCIEAIRKTVIDVNRILMNLIVKVNTSRMFGHSV